MIDFSSNYNALLGRDWIHINSCVPSSLHQALIFLKPSSEMQVHWDDKQPFNGDTNNAEACFYDKYLWLIKMEDHQVKSTGETLTEGQFLKYIKEGFKETSHDFIKPNIISWPKTKDRVFR